VSSATHIEFDTVARFAGWDAAPAAVSGLIREFQARRILELGSGANPTLDAETVAREGLEYTVNDISAEELAKANAVFRRLVWDASHGVPPADARSRFDFIFSRMVNEHVEDGRAYYRNIHAMLAPGGVTAHWFSTLYALPFLANKMMPEALGQFLLRRFAPRDEHRQAKFKAHYSWSRGPSARSVARFEELGFEVVRYHGYFGHIYYRRRLPWLHRWESRKAAWLARHPVPGLTSYAHVVLRKR
jgi:2-polyprenyl-3-methyl-5-hydroxy-6-metoxy-1,4-benzoquinol methylase